MMHPRSIGVAEMPSAAAGAMRLSARSAAGSFWRTARACASGRSREMLPTECVPGPSGCRLYLATSACFWKQARSWGHKGRRAHQGQDGPRLARVCGAHHVCSLDAAANIAREGERLLGGRQRGARGNLGRGGVQNARGAGIRPAALQGVGRLSATIENPLASAMGSVK